MKSISNSDTLPSRADVLLARYYSQYSRAALTKLFELHNVRADGKILKPGDKIPPGKSIEVDVEPLTKPADEIVLPVLYEDDDVLVIDKPAGVISHARGRYWDEASVASFIRKYVSGLSGERAGIVHRLDRATSGVMICAKHASALRYLQAQFGKRTVKKTYVAIVLGVPKPTAAIIDIPVARNLRNPKTFRPDSEGKSAQTAYSVVRTAGKYSLLKLTPYTGRTHQLRVHLKHIEHPIIGDELYGGELADRLYLHAHELHIHLPSGTDKQFISPVPAAFNEKMGV